MEIEVRSALAVPRSAIPGIHWPAVPDRNAALMMALQFQFAASQWWSADEIRARQFEQIGLLMSHAWETVPYYRAQLESADYVQGQPLDDTWWRRLPLLTRSDIQNAGRALVSTRVPLEHGKTSFGQTSGSTGAPVRYLKTELSQVFWRAFTLRDHLWHGRDLSTKMAVIRVHAQRGTAPGWGSSVDRVFATGPCVTLGVLEPVEVQLDWLCEEQPEYLLTHPSILRELVLLSEKRGVRLERLRQVRTFAEALPDELRSLCQRVWGVTLTDMYSSQEVGYMALQCPGHEHYHAQSEGVLVEVLDGSGNPCAPGEVGRVVVTPLHNFAMPLLRYAIGDYAEVGEPCPCGRGLPVLKRILGRERNMLMLPDGQRRWPLVGIAKFGESGLIRQFQVIQKSLESIEVSLVAARPLTPDEESDLRALMISKLGHPFRIEFVYHDVIPRSPSGKFEDFRSELSPYGSSNAA